MKHLGVAGMSRQSPGSLAGAQSLPTPGVANSFEIPRECSGGEKDVHCTCRVLRKVYMWYRMGMRFLSKAEFRMSLLILRFLTISSTMKVPSSRDTMYGQWVSPPCSEGPELCSASS
ncbi:hypothetical protein EYF80_025603 [Liparis tanakae]|uniref:Uncharacterized protein n=1 Tax=Liparis tanakae TaxID=230148 RepID=A0A4Z2HFN3_9TELE|nr:hypothetical protein EYF80_025603 [Liparis tanakae]